MKKNLPDLRSPLGGFETDKTEPLYNFDFICLSFGMLPINNGTAAIAPAAISDFEFVGSERDGDRWKITLLSGVEYYLSPADMAELEATIKRRGEEMKAIQREAMRAQAEMQAGLMAEMQGGIKPAGGGLIAMLPGMNKRGKN